jgi:hypothetical protein
MPARQPTEANLPAVISVSAMAQKCGLSRSRFYDLVKAGIFPSPVYCVRTRRPMFLIEQQLDCLRVKATNIGANGQYILFYSARQPSDGPRPQRSPRFGRVTSAPSDEGSDVLAGLRALGMASATSEQVSDALRSCFPDGWQRRDEGEVLRACWQHLQHRGVA